VVARSAGLRRRGGGGGERAGRGLGRRIPRVRKRLAWRGLEPSARPSAARPFPVFEPHVVDLMPAGAPPRRTPRRERRPPSPDLHPRNENTMNSRILLTSLFLLSPTAHALPGD